MRDKHIHYHSNSGKKKKTRPLPVTKERVIEDIVLTAAVMYITGLWMIWPITVGVVFLAMESLSETDDI